MQRKTDRLDVSGPDQSRKEGRRPARFLYDKRSSLDPAAAPGGDYLADAKLFRRSYVRPIEESEGQPLDSTTAWFLGNTVAFYKLTSNSCVEAKRSLEDCAADGIDGVAFFHVLSGRYTETNEGGFLCLDAGELGLVQSTIETLARSRRPHLAMLFLPRSRLLNSLGSTLLLPGFTIRNLTSAPLAPFVGAQMRVLYDLYGTIAPKDFETALDTAAELLLHLLREELIRASRPEGRDSPLLKEVLGYIEENAGNRTLTVEDIGRAVGMSRSKLYKLFTGQSLSVAGYLSEIRLRRFVEALRGADEARISQLAWACGFDMQPADFARLFKREYGMTPREARIALHEGRDVLPRSAGIAARNAKP